MCVYTHYRVLRKKKKKTAIHESVSVKMKVRDDVFCKWILPEIHHLIYQGFVNSRPRAIQSKDPVFTIFEDISLMMLLMQAKCHFKKKNPNLMML